MNENKKSKKKIIILLTSVVIILALVLLFLFVVKPSLEDYIQKKQIEAKDIVLNLILLQIQEQGYVQISDTTGNSLILVPLTQEQIDQLGQ